MNPYLEFLLSRAYDGALARVHRADLEKSGLTDETIAQQFIRSVPPDLIRPLVGEPAGPISPRDLRRRPIIAEPAITSALLFPFRAPAGGFMDHARVKIFPAQTDLNGHTVKYLQCRGSQPRLYFCAATMTEACTGSDPLWLVEGEKKALAISQLGQPAVGFCGIDAWHRRGTTELLEDFDAVPLDDRMVRIWPDADWRTNRNVHRGLRRFAYALLARGARVELVVPPEVPA